MYSEPVQFSLLPLFDDQDQKDNEDKQMSFDFKDRGTGDDENRDLQPMRL